MPTAETSGTLIERALDAYDAMAWRHGHRVPPGPAEVTMIDARRLLLITRARSEEWLVPPETVSVVDRLVVALEAIDSVDAEADSLDRFPLDLLDALERRSTGRRDRDREAETIAFAFA
jgi:hypothetical protein